MQKTETRPLSLNLYKNEIKMDQRSKYEIWNFETDVAKH
jgi:hypothetical protein